MFGRTFNPLSLKDVTGLSRNNCRKPRPGTWLQRAKKAAGCLRRSHSSHAGSPCMVTTLMMDDISRESLLPEPPQRSLSENLPNLTCAVRLSRKEVPPFETREPRRSLPFCENHPAQCLPYSQECFQPLDKDATVPRRHAANQYLVALTPLLNSCCGLRTLTSTSHPDTFGHTRLQATVVHVHNCISFLAESTH